MQIKTKRYRSAPLHSKVLASAKKLPAKDETLTTPLNSSNITILIVLKVELGSLVKKESFNKTSWQMLRTTKVRRKAE